MNLTYKRQSWWLDAVHRASPISNPVPSETDRAVARITLAKAEARCECAKALATLRVKILKKSSCIDRPT